MNIIKLNQLELRVESYNKNTYFTGENITSTGNCTVITDNMDALNALAEDEITLIQIYHDSELIYNLSDISAHIDSINEYLTDDHISISINISFQLDI